MPTKPLTILLSLLSLAGFSIARAANLDATPLHLLSTGSDVYVSPTSTLDDGSVLAGVSISCRVISRSQMPEPEHRGTPLVLWSHRALEMLDDSGTGGGLATDLWFRSDYGFFGLHCTGGVLGEVTVAQLQEAFGDQLSFGKIQLAPVETQDPGDPVLTVNVLDETLQLFTKSALSLPLRSSDPYEGDIYVLDLPMAAGTSCSVSIVRAPHSQPNRDVPTSLSIPAATVIGFGQTIRSYSRQLSDSEAAYEIAGSLLRVQISRTDGDIAWLECAQASGTYPLRLSQAKAATVTAFDWIARTPPTTP